MPVLVIFIITSLSFYVYYKIKYFRTKKELERKWLSTKASIALGAFVALFGLNRLYISQETISVIISILFLVIGSISIWTGIKAYRYYLPYVEQEYEQQLSRK